MIWVLAGLALASVRFHAITDTLARFRGPAERLVREVVQCRGCSYQDKKFRISKMVVEQVDIPDQTISLQVKQGLVGNIRNIVLHVYLEFSYHMVTWIESSSRLTFRIDYMNFQLEGRESDFGLRVQPLEMQISELMPEEAMDFKAQVVLGSRASLPDLMATMFKEYSAPFTPIQELLHLDPSFLANYAFKGLSNYKKSVVFELGLLGRPFAWPQPEQVQTSMVRMDVSFDSLNEFCQREMQSNIDKFTGTILQYFTGLQLSLAVKSYRLGFRNYHLNPALLAADFEVQVSTYRKGSAFQGKLIFNMVYQPLAQSNLKIKLKETRFVSLDFDDNPVIVPDLKPGELEGLLARQPLDFQWDCEMLGFAGCRRLQVKVAEGHLQLAFDWPE